MARLRRAGSWLCINRFAATGLVQEMISCQDTTQVATSKKQRVMFTMTDNIISAWNCRELGSTHNTLFRIGPELLILAVTDFMAREIK